jgi:beta-galactosidase
MENFGQSYGYILYRKQLTEPLDGTLTLDDLRDYAAVYLDQKLVGAVDRRLNQRSMPIRIPAGGATLDILVENTGRINFGSHLPDGCAGIATSISIGANELTGWEIYTLPMDSPDSIHGWKNAATSGPAFHRGSFTLTTVTDTYLDTSKLGKGFVWVNGHNLVRIWDIGPQKSLYLPAPWLQPGENQIVVFDYTDLDQPTLRGLANPLWSGSKE